jgi:hypothetical protein
MHIILAAFRVLRNCATEGDRGVHARLSKDNSPIWDSAGAESVCAHRGITFICPAANSEYTRDLSYHSRSLKALATFHAGPVARHEKRWEVLQ